MNKNFTKILENYINSYIDRINKSFDSNVAIFNIFDNFFKEVKGGNKFNDDSFELISVTRNGKIVTEFYISEDSLNTDITFTFKFDGEIYALGFVSWKEMGDMFYKINITSNNKVKYSGDFIYKYLLFSALEYSKLKGSYFTMPRNFFGWDIKTLENRNFNDIYLPKLVMDDLHMYINVYKNNGDILRYLMVGNPGVGKTESTIIIANELNKLGVTIIKTNICELLHQKIELAKVLAPSLIILDDIDLSLGNRNSGGFSHLLGDFLDVLDGTDKLDHNVGLIATTNAAHLLDLAAQRPGRFDKTILFDDISKENIKNIILKSLKMNFNITPNETVSKIFTNIKLINTLYDSNMTGSHIFNMVKMTKMKYDTSGEELTSQKIIDTLNHDLEVLKKVRKQSYLNDKIDRDFSGNIGFQRIKKNYEGNINDTSVKEKSLK